MRKLFLISAVLFLGACQYPYIITGPAPGYSEWVVYIESDTEWTGLVGGRGVSGFGDRAFRTTALGSCWTVRKTRVTGLLRAYAMPANLSNRTQNVPKVSDKATTSPYGGVSGCL